MEKKLPNEILNILEQWFIISVTCVKWNGHVSHFFRLLAGVRQGGVLFPFLFAIFIVWLIKLEVLMRVFPPFLCMSIVLYADDTLCIAPSIITLQCLMAVCEKELLYLDTHVNVKKIYLYTVWCTL